MAPTGYKQNISSLSNTILPFPFYAAPQNPFDP
ncbi:hypothetical protein CCACVL1_31014 [Corchorus capsularis]|uniref:Uncharacterized protein n=1 Tax=Corchorus capsularis TaxID=210143 RepID=A0A1R3FU76_COCAP|nr:hypothetical protein CCACVL1_31014 [Corchorus capsularis]